MIVMLVILDYVSTSISFYFVKLYLEAARNNTMQPVNFLLANLYNTHPIQTTFLSNQSINQSITLLKQKDPKAVHCRQNKNSDIF